MLDLLLNIIEKTLTSVCVLFPYLFVTYLILEYLEHKVQNLSNIFTLKRRYLSPILAGFTGIIPQCGFSVAASNLYAAKVISVGTLATVFLTTSDEMLPVLISNNIPFSVVSQILILKTIIAISFGFLLDLFLFRKNAGKINAPQIEKLCTKASCQCGSRNIFHSAFIHSIRISVFIFSANLVLNSCFEFVDPDHFKKLIFQKTFLGPFVLSVIGLIPNCAISAITTQLFSENTIPLGSFLSAILANSGIGILILFHVNKPTLNSFKILFFILFVSFLSGALINLCQLSIF